jgi:hypothetical protein
MSGGNQVGQISGQASGDALNLGNMSIEALKNQYQALGLGATGATPSGPTTGTPAGAGKPGATGVPGGTAGVGAGTTPTDPGSFGAGPTGFQMDAGTLPSWTGGIPQMFQGALGEAQFQDLGQTASAAAGSAGAKGQTFAGIGSALSGI